MTKTETLYNRYSNLLVWWILANSYGWTNCSIDYLEEKFLKVFNNYPDKLPNDKEWYMNSLDLFRVSLLNYEKKWNIKLTINQIKILYYIHIDFCLGNNNHLKSFDKCFNSYNNIKNENLIYLLHETIRLHVDNIIKNDRIFMRKLKITSIVNRP